MKAPFRSLQKLHVNRHGTVAVEYLLLLATIVLPIVLLIPFFLMMIRVYSARLIDAIVLPFF